MATNYDLDAAKAFLLALDSTAGNFTFQTFDDNSGRKDPSLTCVLHGNIETLAERLADLSMRGAGVYVTVNETDGKGRKLANITRCRALYADMDGQPIDPIANWLQPSITVESSPGNFHLYWVGDFTPKQSERFMQEAIGRFGADKNCKDIARVLRLPGFPHQKVRADKGLDGTPFMVRVVENRTEKRGPFVWESDIEPLLSQLPARTIPSPANTDTPPGGGRILGGSDFKIDLGTATGANDRELMRELLQRAPNNLDRGDWVKLAASLRAEWGDEFKDAFVAFSGRYSGSPCSVAEAVRLWNSATPSVVTGAGPAFALMKAALGDVEFSALHAMYSSSWHTVAPGLSVTGQAASLLDGFKIWNASDLAAQTFDPIRWLVEDLVPTPGLAMIVGAPKVGKSWFAMMLALQIASSGDEVIYIASEDNDRRLCDRLTQLGIFPPEELKLISGLSNPARIPRGDEAMEFLMQLKQEYPATACIIIDTVAAIRVPSQREKNYDETEREFAALRRLAHDLGIAIIVVHHSRKSTGMEASPLETILGSQGIGATVETALVLQQDVGSRGITVHLTGKDVDQRDIAYRWDYPGFQPQGDPVVAKLGPFQRRCLDCIQQHPRCRQALLEHQLRGDKGQISKAVRTLVERGLVQRTDDGLLIAL
jgi:hypothetical protein